MTVCWLDEVVQSHKADLTSGNRVSRLSNLIREAGGKCRYLLAHSGFRRSPITTLARLLWWRLHCALGIPATVVLLPWNIRFYLPPQWHGAGTTMIYALRGNYEKELQHLGRFLSPGMVVVDGGASCGIYTAVAASLVGSKGLVLSFEPSAEAFDVLEKNIRLNGLQNVCAYRAALSDRNGEAILYQQGCPNGFSLGLPDREEVKSQAVETRALWRVVQEKTSAPVGLIKLDIEGAEELALHGAEPIISRFHPVIILEINGVAAKRIGLKSSGAWQFLEGLGYQLFSLTDQGELSPIGHPPALDVIVNVVAIHGGQTK